jgi:hypothetical protein
MRGMLQSIAAACATVATIGVVGCADQPAITTPRTSMGAEVPMPLPPVDDQDGTRTYAVKIENLTYGQPLSPGVIATHKAGVRLFRLGDLASEGIRRIAEEGDPSAAVAELRVNGGAYEVIATEMPIHRMSGPGTSSLTVRIRAAGDADRLSMATMLVCTNDGFTGADGIALPADFGAETHYAMAYDAGTERNDEVTRNLADGCGMIGPVPFPADGNGRNPAEEQAIAPHPGIRGVGDLVPTLHGWRGPVARITVARIR